MPADEEGAEPIGEAARQHSADLGLRQNDPDPSAPARRADRLLKVVSAALVAVAVAIVAVGWMQSPDPVTAAEAVTAARGAYASAGLPKAEVDPHPKAGVYDTPQGVERIPVWKTKATIKGGTVELWLTKADAESVFLDDRTADGASQLLTDEQFEKLADHYENPARQRKIRGNIALTLAALLIAVLGVRLVSLAPARPRRPLRDPEPAPEPDAEPATEGPERAPARRRRSRPAPAPATEAPRPAVPRLAAHRTRPLRARGDG